MWLCYGIAATRPHLMELPTRGSACVRPQCKALRMKHAIHPLSLHSWSWKLGDRGGKSRPLRHHKYAPRRWQVVPTASDERNWDTSSRRASRPSRGRVAVSTVT